MSNYDYSKLKNHIKKTRSLDDLENINKHGCINGADLCYYDNEIKNILMRLFDETREDALNQAKNEALINELENE